MTRKRVPSFSVLVRYMYMIFLKVELGVLSVLNTLDLNQVGVVDLLGKRPPESGHDTLHVQARPCLLTLTLRCSDLLADLREEFLDVHLRCLTQSGLHLVGHWLIGAPM